MKPCSRCVNGRRGHSFGPWAMIAVASTLLEVLALRNGRREHTFSHAVRSACRTDTQGGRMLFTAIWVLFSYWWVNHVTASPHNFE